MEENNKNIKIPKILAMTPLMVLIVFMGIVGIQKNSVSTAELTTKASKSQYATSIKFVNAKNIKVNQALYLRFKYTPKNAKQVGLKSCTSSSPSTVSTRIKTINKEQQCEIIGLKEGSVKIKVIAIGGKATNSATIKVLPKTVTKTPTKQDKSSTKESAIKISFNLSSVTLRPTKTYTLKVVPTSKNANIKNLKCSSSNEKVATTTSSYNKYCKIIAVGKGNATITATVNGKYKATAKVKVLPNRRGSTATSKPNTTTYTKAKCYTTKKTVCQNASYCYWENKKCHVRACSGGKVRGTDGKCH